LAARHQLPDFFLPNPDFAVVGQADQGHVDLVEANLRAAGRVDDGVDRARQHEVRPELLAHWVARVLAGVNVLVLALLADSLALGLRGDEIHLPGVYQGTLHIQGERVDVDVLVAQVAHLADDDRRFTSA